MTHPASRSQLALLALVLGFAPRQSEADADAVDGVVLRAVRSHYEELHGCYRKALARDRGKGGTLFVRATLGAGDAVRAVKIARDEVKVPEATACVLTWMRGWTLKGAAAAGADAGSELVVPLTFRAAPRQFAVRRDDAPELKLTATGTVRPLLTAKNSGATQASMALLDVQGKLALPGKAGVDQVLYVLYGRGTVANLASSSATRVRMGSALWIPADAKVVIAGTMRLVQLFVPGGLEAEYAAGREPILGTRPGVAVAVAPGEVKPLSLDGKLRVTPLLHSKRIVHGRFYLGLVEARAGAEMASHLHDKQAELVYIVSGAAIANVDGVSEEVGAGAALYLAAGTRHAMKASKELRAVQLYAPAGPEQRFFSARRR
jgi:quercetin dioxygenase-like cupin family protein